MTDLKPGAHAPAHQRRERYYQHRRDGLRVTDAAAAVGVLDYHLAHRYERWYQAAERGETIIPGTPGRKAAAR